MTTLLLPFSVVAMEREVTFTSEELNLLPKQVREYLALTEKELKDAKLVNSTATVIELAKQNDEIIVVSEKSFDFSDKKQIKDFVDHKKRIKAKYNKDSDANIMLGGPYEGSQITIGLNVSSFSKSGYSTAYQTHGWWEWDSDIMPWEYDNLYDTMGIVWNGGLTRINTPYALCNNVHNGGPITIGLLKDEDDLGYNGLLWEIQNTSVTEGAVLAQIGSKGYYGNTAKITFEYNYNTRDTNAFDWGYIGELVAYALKLFPIPDGHKQFIKQVSRPY